MISITTLSSKTIPITIIKNDTHHYHKKRYPSLIIRNDIHRYTIKNGIHHYTIIKYDIHHYTIIKNSDGTYENNDGNSDIGSDALHSRQKSADSWRQSVQHDRCDRAVATKPLSGNKVSPVTRIVGIRCGALHL